MLAQEKLNIVSTESVCILHDFLSQKYFKLNYHNLRLSVLKMLVLRQMRLCQISPRFLQQPWTRFHALTFALYVCNRPKDFLLKCKSEHMTS